MTMLAKQSGSFIQLKLKDQLSDELWCGSYKRRVNRRDTKNSEEVIADRKDKED